MADYFVYLLFSETVPKTYVGSSSDPAKRLKEHNSGSNRYTRKFLPWKIIYTEKYSDKSEALKREVYYKTHAGRKQLKKIIDNIPR